MYGIIEKKAGEFIDLDNYFKQINDESIDIIERDAIASKFLLLLLGEGAGIFDIGVVTECYMLEIADIKAGFEFIYNPPDTPTTIETETATIGSEYRKEFAEIYGGYVELVYLIATVFKYKPEEVLNMKCQDFLFWGNYLLHKKFVENIK